jgi:hypothetical protein
MEAETAVAEAEAALAKAKALHETMMEAKEALPMYRQAAEDAKKKAAEAYDIAK